MPAHWWVRTLDENEVARMSEGPLQGEANLWFTLQGKSRCRFICYVKVSYEPRRLCGMFVACRNVG